MSSQHSEVGFESVAFLYQARLVSWNCFTKSVPVCSYVCMYICLSFRTHVSKPFTWSLKAACMQTIKAKQSLYYTHAQVSSPLKACFFPNRKPGIATILRLQLFRRPAPKKQRTRPHGPPGMRILSCGKWAWPNENEEQPKGLLKEFYNTIVRL